jgi:Domain of unknown function (DUF4190)
VSDFPPPGEQPSAPSPPSPPPAPPTQSSPAPGWWQASDGNWYPPESAPSYRPPPAYGPPSGYAPPPAYGGAGYGYTPYAPSRGTNGLAIASLVLGILWLEWIGAILAVIFGHIALGQIKQRQQGGRGLAIAGITLGWIWIAVLLVVIVVAVTSS